MIERSFLHLSQSKENARTESSCIESIKAIEKLFNVGYLESKESKGILPKLWQRLDILATNQLITLGDSIVKLYKQGSPKINDWLKDNASKSKKDLNAHGYLKEILVGSYFCSENDEVNFIPAPKFQQAYDIEIIKNNSSFFISIKNFGISKNHRDFINISNRLYRLTELKSKYIGKSLNLKIFHEGVLNENDLEEYTKAINQFSYGSLNEIMEVKNGKLTFSEIKSEYASPEHISWQTNIFAHQAKNEQRRFLQKIIKEIKNMRGFFANKPDAMRVLFVRVDEICNLEWLTSEINAYSEKKSSADLGVDLIVIQQSVVCATTDSFETTKRIVHLFKLVDMVFKQNRLVDYLSKYKFLPFSLKVPVGEILSGYNEFPSKSVDNIDFKEIRNIYVYQKGVYRKNFQKKPDGSYYSKVYDAVPEGISVEIVLPEHMNNSKILSITTKLAPPSDKLDII